jgi:hypothetical protein
VQLGELGQAGREVKKTDIVIYTNAAVLEHKKGADGYQIRISALAPTSLGQSYSD